MNKLVAAFTAALLICSNSVQSASNPFSSYITKRFSGNEMETRGIEGLQERIRDGRLPLHINDFLVLMLKNATDIQVTRLDTFTAADRIISAKSPFDPAFSARFSALRSVSPLIFQSGGSSLTLGGGTGGGTTGGSSVINLPQTIDSLAQTSSLAYSQLLPTGQTLGTTFTATRSSGNSYTFPITFGNLNFTLTQPLLQNRRNLQFRAPIAIARTQLMITSEQSEAAIGTVVANAARQYWAAVQARDNIHVQQMTLDLATKSYERDKLALQLGALARLDIFQSQTQVAERNRDLLQAQYTYRIALDGLRRLIGADLTPEFRRTELVLEDDPAAVPARSTVLPFEDALSQALSARPEAKAAKQRIDVDQLSAKVSRDALLPRLDLSVQGGATGPGLNQIVTGSTLGVVNSPYPGIGETLKQVLAFNYPSYGFNVQLNFPFQNSTARANLADALVNKARDAYSQRLIEQQITLDIRQAINSIDLADASIGAATQARDLARQNVQAENQKYELGSITAFELLDAQTRLASSESALLNAYVTYQQAFVDYRRATWTLLDGMGMVVETPKVR